MLIIAFAASKSALMMDISQQILIIAYLSESNQSTSACLLFPSHTIESK